MKAISSSVKDFKTTLEEKNGALTKQLGEMKIVQTATSEEVKELKTELTGLKDLIKGKLLDDIKALLKPLEKEEEEKE